MSRPGFWNKLRGMGRIFLLASLFVAFLGLTTAALAWVLSWIQGTPSTSINLYIGLVCSLIAWLFVAVFHLRRETFQVPISDPGMFVEALKDLLSEMGYEVTRQKADCWQARPHFQSFLFGGGVNIRLEQNQAVLTGPKVCVEVMRNRLRLDQHLEKVQQAFQEGKRRQGTKLLKRVQLSMRVPQELIPQLHEHVLEPLARNAAILCDLNLLLISEEGLPESVLEDQVKPWLAKQGVTLEVHKDHVQRQAVNGHPRPELSLTS